MGFIIIYITHKNMQDARKIGKYLLNKRLIACVNYFPIKSSFWWKNKIENSNEIVSLVKTKKANWKKVEMEIKKIHPYKTPCVMKFEVKANKGYED